MYKLIVSDLDGTLLNAEHRLGAFTRDVLLALQARGIELVLASGRHFRDIQSLSERLGGRSCLISSNGAAIHDAEGQAVYCRSIDPECLDFLLHDARFAETHINVYRADDWLVATPKPDLLRYHQDSGLSYQLADFERLGPEPVLKVFYYHEDSTYLSALEQQVLERYGDLLTTTYSLPVVLEVMARGVSKGEALSRLLRRLGIAPSEVIAFGDGPNDLEMLRLAGKAVLMGNASPRLKAALPGVETIGRHADEAVARYLERLL